MTYQELEKDIRNLIKQALKKEFGLELREVQLVRPPKVEMGDLAFGCFEVGKKIKQNPVEVALKLARTLNVILSRSEESQATAVGPYVNFTIDDNKLFHYVTSYVASYVTKKNGKEVVLEYSSPNTNKPQHIGHLRNNALGDSLARILESQGYKVHKVGIINDRGIHICKSMLMYQKYGKSQTPKDLKLKPDHFVGHFYQMFEGKSKDDPTLIDQAQEMLQKWEAGDKQVRQLWKKLNDWVYQGWDETYKKLAVTFDKLYYESEVFAKGKEVVEQGLKSKLFYKRDDGAVEINLEKEGLDKKVLLRSDGTSVYITQDLYLAELRAKEYKKAEKFIYIVGKEQEYHFKVLFAILEKLGLKKDFYHLNYGLIQLSEGKMSSREGTVVNADDLIQEVVTLAKKEISERNKDCGIRKSSVQLFNCSIVHQRAAKIGLGALKYYLLHVDAKKDITFDSKRAVSFEGDTGPYIMYTFARIQSIKLKIKNYKLQIKNLKLNLEEREIINKLSDFQSTLQKAAAEYDPSILAHYLFELASIINSFYHKHHVLKAEENVKAARLRMLEACSVVIKKGLGLLGISVVERM